MALAAAVAAIQEQSAAPAAPVAAIQEPYRSLEAAVAASGSAAGPVAAARDVPEAGSVARSSDRCCGKRRRQLPEARRTPDRNIIIDILEIKARQRRAKRNIYLMFVASPMKAAHA